MAEVPTPEEIAERVAQRRKQLIDSGAFNPSLRAPARSSARSVALGWAPRTRVSLSLMLVAALGAIALVACVGTATAVVYGSAWLRGALSDPSTTVQSFYGAVQAGDYARAYSYFSDEARTRTSESAFVGQFASYDAINGPVVSYTLGSTHIGAAGNTASIMVAVSRRANPRGTEAHALALVKQSGQWQINAIVVTINGSPPAQH